MCSSLLYSVALIKRVITMARRYSSLHHNIGFQDPMTGGVNVKFHREHRSKKGRHNISHRDRHGLLMAKKEIERLRLNDLESDV